MSSPCVLFVDDESMVLNGLRRGMRTVAPDWPMHFASNAMQALDLLATEPVDVVVSDLRMPSISGDVLHREVLLQYPWVIRLVLSGMVDAESLAKGSQWSERYLTKPCSPENLRREISEAIGARDNARTLAPGATTGCLSNAPTILYVENAAEDVGLLSQALAAIGSGVILASAAHGAAALELLHRRGGHAGHTSPDVVLLELSLLSKNGYEVLACCRSGDVGLIPVIVFTASDDAGFRRDAVQRGAAMALIKPHTWDNYLEIARLVARFAKLVARRAPEPRLPTQPIPLPPAGAA